MVQSTTIVERDPGSGVLCIRHGDKVVSNLSVDTIQDHIKALSSTAIEFRGILNQFSSLKNWRKLLRPALTSCKEIVISEVEVGSDFLSRVYRCAMLYELSVVAISKDQGRLSVCLRRSDAVLASHRFAVLTETSPFDLEKLATLVSESLDSGTGLSVVRINHCEPRIAGYEILFDRVDINTTFDIQWGRKNVTGSEARWIASQMQQAMRTADVVGVPDPKLRPENDLNDLENSVYVLNNSLNLFNADQRFLSVNFHYRMHEQGLLLPALTGAEEIHCITGRRVGDQLQEATGRIIKTISIPAESKFSVDGSDLTKDHFNEKFEEVMSEIRAEDRRGQIFLVGAGILGKLYCAEIKKAGGVAMDIGSLFDAWAGMNTRGTGFASNLSL